MRAFGPVFSLFRKELRLRPACLPSIDGDPLYEPSAPGLWQDLPSKKQPSARVFGMDLP